MVGSSLQIGLWPVVLIAEGLKEGVCPGLKANCPCVSRWGDLFIVQV